MLVRATGRGFYYWMRQTGDVFEIPEDLFEPLWQEKVSADAEVAAPVPAPDDEPVQAEASPEIEEGAQP